MIDLSVIVVSWNTRELLLACLRAARASLDALAPDLASEIWVVDNGSRDGSAAAVTAAHPEVKQIGLPQNRGYAAGNNAALREARGRVVLLLNTDVELSAEALRRALAAFDANPSVGALGVQLLHADGRRQNSIHAFPSLWTELVPSLILQTLWPARFPSKRTVHHQPVRVEAVLGAALFVRREAMLEVGLLCEDYFFFLEETDWCWRMSEAGWTVLFVPDVTLVHASGASSKRRFPAATRIEYHRSLYHFLELRRGRRARRLAQAARTVRGAFTVFALALGAPAGAGPRGRLAERWALWRWHLDGCPPGPGLAAVVDEAPGTRNPSGDPEKATGSR